MIARIEDAPLCDAGRCAVLLRAIADERRGLVDRLGAQLHTVISGVLVDLGHPVDERVWEVVAGRIRELLGDQADAGGSFAQSGRR